jgi:hypothetical protein
VPPSPADLAFLASRLERIRWLVSSEGSPGVERRVAKAAVAQADRWLAEHGSAVVLAWDDIEREKAARADVGVADPSAGLSPIQIVARDFGADLRLEIAFAVAAGGREGRYSAAVTGTMNLLDAATGLTLSTSPFASQTFYSPSSADAAAIGAIGSTTWTLMPQVVAQARGLLMEAWNGGLRYEIAVWKLAGPEATAFVRALSIRLWGVAPIPAPLGELRFEGFGFLSEAELESVVRSSAAEAGISVLGLSGRGGRLVSFYSAP